jgi:hypothetical protein
MYRHVLMPDRFETEIECIDLIPRWTVHMQCVEAPSTNAVLAGATVVQGWRVTEHAAIAPHTAASTMIIPILVFLAPLALVVSGVAPQLVGPGSVNASLLAVVIGSVLTATVAISALRYPTGISTPTDVRSYLPCLPGSASVSG